MLIGLCGAHRTGKTTLAIGYAERTDAVFLPTNASEVFNILGYSPKEEYPLEVVLDIQEAILRSFLDIWHESWLDDGVSITDRTPVDLIAYTLAHVGQNELTPELEERLLKYVDDCYKALNEYFGILVVLQPGIELEESDKSARASLSYMDHINKLILGSVVDERVEVPSYRIPQLDLDIDNRIDQIESMVKETVRAYRKVTKKLVKH